MKKVLITGGHLTPAQALIEQLNREKVQIIFVGRQHSIEGSKSLSVEYQKIRKLNIKFISLTTGRIQRKFTIHTIPSILKIPIGFVQSMVYLLIYRPAVVVSFGGYLSTPIVVCAWLLGIPAITHEQATRVGIANKINSIICREFLSAWPQKDIENAEVIGNPMRTCIFQKSANSEEIKQFLKTHKKFIYITGGNLGSHIINKIIFQSLARLKNYPIIHQIGTANYGNDYQIAQDNKTKKYLPIKYLNEGDVGAVLTAAHIVVSRSGANTIWELAILKKVAILIPLPISGGREQEFNAQILTSANSAKIINQKDLTVESLISTVGEIDANYPKYQKNASSFAQKIKSNSAEILKDHVMRYINNV